MVKNCYLLPLTSDIINHLQQAWLFTKFDVCWGYNNVHIKVGNEWKAAFTTKVWIMEILHSLCKQFVHFLPFATPLQHLN